MPVMRSDSCSRSRKTASKARENTRTEHSWLSREFEVYQETRPAWVFSRLTRAARGLCRIKLKGSMIERQRLFASG